MKATLPDNLTDDELALLRLAGELPAGAEAPPASADLADAFARLDAPLRRDAERLSLPPAMVAARRVVGAMAGAVEVPPEPKKSFKIRVPTWAVYPAAAAALLVFGMLGWWYTVHDEYAQSAAVYQDDGGPTVLMFPGNPEIQPTDQNATDEQINRQFDSIILPERSNGGEVERQYAQLKFLEETMQ
ncbi:MAG: hypothetical protein QM754_01760 [Tepidisphaeraceae bacterium]